MVPTASSCLFAFICASPVKSSAEPTPTKINKQLHGFWPGFTMVFGFTKGSWVHDGFWDSQCSIDAPGFTMGSGIHNGFTICNIVAISYYYSISDCISITVSVHCISVWYYQSPFQGHFRIVPFSGISSHIKPAESSNWIGDWGGGGGFLRFLSFSLSSSLSLSLSLSAFGKLVAQLLPRSCALQSYMAWLRPLMTPLHFSFRRKLKAYALRTFITVFADVYMLHFTRIIQFWIQWCFRALKEFRTY